eukprot:scaffold683_cov212-Chaetoceros_neogracile.AAC.2
MELGKLLGCGAYSNVRAMKRKAMKQKAMKRKGSLLLGAIIDEDDTGNVHEPCHSEVSSLSLPVVSSTIPPKLHIATKRSKSSDFSTHVGFFYELVLPSTTVATDEESDDSVKYAVKSLRNDLDGETKISGAIDLTIEAQFLLKLSHPNIVKLYGQGGSPGSEDFFIVVARVQGTLSDTIQLFRRLTERLKLNGISQNGNRLSRKEKKAELHSYYGRSLCIGRQLASALHYLHENSILFRDLKPQNIGLDGKSRVKIFDFGLAKELKSESRQGVDQYRGRKDVGTRRYMAPEIYNGSHYGLPADVYSFAIVIWQLFSLTVPFKGHSIDKHVHRTYVRKIRPPIKFKWPRKLKRMLSKGWHHNPSCRPKMNECLSVMEELSRKDGYTEETFFEESRSSFNSY